MLDLVGPGDLRRGTSLFATVTGLAKIAGPAVAGIIIAVTGETVVFFIDAASFLGVIAVMASLSSRTGSALSSRTGSAPYHATLGRPPRCRRRGHTIADTTGRPRSPIEIRAPRRPKQLRIAWRSPGVPRRTRCCR